MFYIYHFMFKYTYTTTVSETKLPETTQAPTTVAETTTTIEATTTTEEIINAPEIEVSNLTKRQKPISLKPQPYGLEAGAEAGVYVKNAFKFDGKWKTPLV